MSTEREWVETVKADIAKAISGQGLILQTQKRLPYAMYVTGYAEHAGKMATVIPDRLQSPAYQTYLLIAEPLASSRE